MALVAAIGLACEADVANDAETGAGDDAAEGSLECDPGLDPCDGACVDLQATVEHCGWCGNSCAGAVPASCVEGECVADCDAPLVGCGFECVALETDVAHCGACGRRCPPGLACEGGECRCGDLSVSLSGDVQPIFDASCATVNCHTPASRKGDLDLSAGAAWAELVNAPVDQCSSGVLVAPGDVHGSYLLDKLLGVDMCQGARMPRQADPLSDAETGVIADWICQGAADG